MSRPAGHSPSLQRWKVGEADPYPLFWLDECGVACTKQLLAAVNASIGICGGFGFAPHAESPHARCAERQVRMRTARLRASRQTCYVTDDYGRSTMP
jgi:hypothetical protein